DPAWVAERWLGPYKALEPAPPALGVTRSALHMVAERVISPARQRANGKIGLRWTLGGFGTPYFGAYAQIRVEGGELVVDAAGDERRAPLTTGGGAAAAIRLDLTDSSPLEIGATAWLLVGDWFGFSSSGREELRGGAAGCSEGAVSASWSPDRPRTSWPRSRSSP